jgi:DegV family protein with EDD domain
MAIKLMTDSACDLSRDILKEAQVDILPIYVSIDGKDYKDGVDITPEEIYKGMRNGKVYKTAQISVMDFEKAFEEYALKGMDILHLSFSSGLSGTYSAAVLAADMVRERHPEVRIEIVDTKAGVNGLGLIVLDTIEDMKNGATMDQLLVSVEDRIRRIEHIFTVADLDYLYRGGRLSKGAAIMGNMLNIQPVLRVDEEGKLQQIDKVRGRKKLFGRILELMAERADDLDQQTVTISHCDDEGEAQRLVDAIREKFGTKRFIVDLMGAAVGAHTGPGTVCVFFYNSKK